jgi:hypothetical protein
MVRRMVVEVFQQRSRLKALDEMFRNEKRAIGGGEMLTGKEKDFDKYSCFGIYNFYD